VVTCVTEEICTPTSASSFYFIFVRAAFSVTLCQLCLIFFCFCTGLSVYALSSVSATEIDRLMREATRKRSTSISYGCGDGKVQLCCSVIALVYVCS